MRLDLKGSHYEKEMIIMWCDRRVSYAMVLILLQVYKCIDQHAILLKTYTVLYVNCMTINNKIN